LYTSGYNRSVSNLSGTKANLSQADASFKESKSSYDRNRTLFEKELLKSDWDKAVASYEVAKAAKQTTYFNVQSASATVNEARQSRTYYHLCSADWNNFYVERRTR
jgi:HlyD family secretion protein